MAMLARRCRNRRRHAGGGKREGAVANDGLHGLNSFVAFRYRSFPERYRNGVVRNRKLLSYRIFLCSPGNGAPRNAGRMSRNAHFHDRAGLAAALGTPRGVGLDAAVPAAGEGRPRDRVRRLAHPVHPAAMRRDDRLARRRGRGPRGAARQARPADAARQLEPRSRSTGSSTSGRSTAATSMRRASAITCSRC